MSAKDPPNLKRWVRWGVKKAGKQGYRRKPLSSQSTSQLTTFCLVDYIDACAEANRRLWRVTSSYETLIGEV